MNFLYIIPYISRPRRFLPIPTTAAKKFGRRWIAAAVEFKVKCPSSGTGSTPLNGYN